MGRWTKKTNDAMQKQEVVGIRYIFFVSDGTSPPWRSNFLHIPSCHHSCGIMACNYRIHHILYILNCSSKYGINDSLIFR